MNQASVEVLMEAAGTGEKRTFSVQYLAKLKGVQPLPVPWGEGSSATSLPNSPSFLLLSPCMCLSVGLYMRNSPLSPAQFTRPPSGGRGESTAVDEGVLGVNHSSCLGGHHKQCI